MFFVLNIIRILYMKIYPFQSFCWEIEEIRRNLFFKY